MSKSKIFATIIASFFLILANVKDLEANCAFMSSGGDCSSCSGNYTTKCNVSGQTVNTSGYCNGTWCSNLALYCSTGAEAQAQCGGVSCTPTPGACNKTAACEGNLCGCCIANASGCNSDAAVCPSCDNAGNPPGNGAQACCGDYNHFNCLWTGSNCIQDPGKPKSYQCFQGTCIADDQTSCNTGGGCQWTQYSQNPDGSYCATACSGGTWQPPVFGSCTDSCGGSHQCVMPPPPSYIQGFKVQLKNPADAGYPAGSINTTLNTLTVTDTPTGAQSVDNGYGCGGVSPACYKVKINFLPSGGTVSNSLTVPIPSGWSVGYTKCQYGDPGCGSNDSPSTLIAGTAGPAAAHTGTKTFIGCNDNTPGATCTSVQANSNAVVVSATPDSFVGNVWFHFCQNSTVPWRDTSACLPDTPGTCGVPAHKTQINECGATRSLSCTPVCAYFQTYWGNVMTLGYINNPNLPATGFVCRMNLN